MPARMLIAALSIITPAIALSAQEAIEQAQPPTNLWWGEVRLPNAASLFFQFDADRQTFSVPMQGVVNAPLSGVVLDDTRALFTYETGGNEFSHARFHLEFIPGPTDEPPHDRPDAAVGTLHQQGAWMVARMMRGPLPDEPDSRDLPIRKDLDAHRNASYWTGQTDANGTPLKFCVTIRDDGMGGHAAILDMPMQRVASARLADVAVSEDGMAFTLVNPGPASNNAEWVLSIAGDTATGTCSQIGQQWPTTLTRASSLAEALSAATARRPQHPTPPFPYRTQDITFTPPAGHTMAGTLTLPDTARFGEGPYPAVVLVSGSGQQDRDETVAGHKPFLVIAHHLTNHGIAVLRYDDQGVGDSGGNPSEATTFDFADDARAAARWLDARGDTGIVGIVGHSEGGLIAPIVAADTDEVGFICLLAGMGLTGEQTILTQSIAIAVAEGIDREAAEAANVHRKALLKALKAYADDDQLREHAEALVRFELDQQGLASDEQILNTRVEQAMGIMTSPWYRTLLTIDPADYLKDVRVPVLVLQGEKDTQVLPREHTNAIMAALPDAQPVNGRATLKLYPNLNHLFQTSASGAMSEYATIEETFNDEPLRDLTEWILALDEGG